jgi:putative ABC transport system substrate-binding protein
MSQMRRREFITLLGGAAAAWPLAAQAQQAMPVIGFLRDATAAGSEFMVNGLRKGLAEAGFVEGRNLTIEYAWTEGRSERLSAVAAELVGQHVQRLGLMYEMVPNVTDFAVLAHPTYPSSTPFISDVKAGSRTLGLRIEVFNASTESEIDTAFAALSARRLGALLIANHPLFTTRRDQIIALAARYAVPTMYVEREFASAGGLITYGTDLPEVYRLTGGYAGRILKGEKPSDLPVLLPTKFEMIINLRTAKALGLDVPDKLLALADEVIE